MFYVYLLVSETFKKRYIGSTNNLRDRYKKHNFGQVFSTKKYRPWKLTYYEAYIFEDLARQREKNLKSHGNAKREMLKRAGVVKINTQ